MEKIKMPVPIAELDGDEMTHILWGMIKDQLIKPFVDLNTEYYDLSLPNRDRTEDAVTRQAAEAIKRLHVGVKCATITPNYQRQEEYGLKQLWKSPNATIRAAMDGTVFRSPILISRVKPVVTCWKKPITIARHAYGDVYKAVEYRVPGPGKAELVFTDDHGAERSLRLADSQTRTWRPGDRITLGEDGVSAYGVLMYVQLIFIGTAIGYSIGCAPIVSYHYGAGHHDELKNMLKKSLTLMGITGVALTMLALGLAAPLAKIFVGYDEGLLNLTRHAFSIFSFSFLLSGLNIFASGFFTALNNGLISAVISFARTLVFQAACVLLLPAMFGVDGIWYATLVAEGLTCLLSLWLIDRKKHFYHYDK